MYSMKGRRSVSTAVLYHVEDSSSEIPSTLSLAEANHTWSPVYTLLVAKEAPASRSATREGA